MVRLKSNKTKNSASSIGGRLKKARLDKGLSLEEAHKDTKIHPRVLEAIEEDRLEKILGRTYVKAFIRNYAHYLGLDVKQIILEYSSKLTPQTDEKSHLEPKPFVIRREKGFNRTIVIALAIIAWVFILGFATTKFIQSYGSFVKNRRRVIAERTELKSEEKITPARGEEPRPSAKDIKGGLIPIPKNRTISLTITAHEKSWLKVTQDGEVAFHGILSKNSKETWQANREIILAEVGRPEVLRLNVNGKDIDFSGKRPGKNILITHEGIDLEPRQKN